MKRILLAASAAALSLTLAAGAPVLAQEQTADAVMTGMSQLGMETEGLVLTEDQVLAIQAVLSDAGVDDTEKVAQIEALLAN